ncbi:DNA polymerase IV [Microbacterium sp. NPDC056736]|uniref:DNA polymerase IV n=1 Tax=Microbacterium sp. NPDC056736 TaxID=3345932 RepID=UPI0036708BB2
MSDGARGGRWVLHVDLDQFIAAVEVLRNPTLAGKPVIVGGRGDPAERAVVSTASYEARQYGVGSGMPLRIAARKVPDAVILPVDAPAYLAASDEVMATLREQPGAVVQVLGWDEAFMGVTTTDPEAYARRVQAAVLDRTRLHCSVGIGDTLVRAKNATDFGKPRGVFRLTAENWLEVMGDKPTAALWGVGSKVSKRLALLGVTTVRQLAVADPGALAGEFGPKMGPWYRQLGRGDGSAVVDDTPWVARGHSKETTFQVDIVDPQEIEDAARRLLDQVLDEVAGDDRPVVGLGLKVRYAPFLTKTFTKKIPTTSDRAVVVERALELVAKIEPGRPIRLLGLRAEMAMPDDAREGRTPTRSGW